MSKKLVIPCEVYSRVVGYYRPVDNFNPGKQQEFRERVMYDQSFKKVFIEGGQK
jgi:anaerobic ribonucleoside-triphosphate reductase